MDNGIGRAGYRLLGFVFLLVGVVGLAILWNSLPTPVETVAWLGLGVVTAALLAGVFLTVTLTRGPPMPAGTAPQPAQETTFKAPAKTAGPNGLDYEYPDAAGKEVVDFNDLVPPAAKPKAAAPAPQPVKDPRTWPQRPRKNAAGAVVDAQGRPERRQELTQKFTQNSPMVRGILQSNGAQAHQQIPEITADLPATGTHPTAVPDGYTRGKCGECRTVLLAPTARPLRLKCPRCLKTTVLRG